MDLDENKRIRSIANDSDEEVNSRDPELICMLGIGEGAGCGGTLA